MKRRNFIRSSSLVAFSVGVFGNIKWDGIKYIGKDPTTTDILGPFYRPGAPIGWHKDRPVFGEIMGLSLASSCSFRLRKRFGGKWQRVTVRLEPRSAYFLEGAVRWEWEHSIPPVKTLRYSITFRNLRKSFKY